MSFGAPKRKPGDDRKSSSATRNNKSSSVASLLSHSNKNARLHSSSASSLNRSTSGRPRKNSLNSKQASSSPTMSTHHHNYANPSNLHKFLLRGERYSMACDMFGFVDEFAEEDPRRHDHIFDEEDEFHNPSSPLERALERWGSSLPESSCLSPETYDSLAVMERMNHTRRLLESMQVERQECLRNIERGKEIYRLVFGRSIVQGSSSAAAKDLSRMMDGSSVMVTPSSEQQQRVRSNNNSSEKKKLFGDEDDDEDDFEARHAKGEPKLQSARIFRKKAGKKEGENKNDSENDEDEELARVRAMKAKHSAKKESVFERLTRTPPRASWMEAAEKASATKNSANSRALTPKRITNLRNSSYAQRMFDKHSKTRYSPEKNSSVTKKKRNQSGAKRNRHQNELSSSDEDKAEQEEDAQKFDENGIPKRFQSRTAHQNIEEEEESFENIPQIIRTPLPQNEDLMEERNYFNIVTSSSNAAADSSSHYTIEYNSPARLPLGLLQQQKSNNYNTNHQSQMGMKQQKAGGNEVFYSGGSQSMMPAIYRMQDPATNFGSNLEWTGATWN